MITLRAQASLLAPLRASLRCRDRSCLAPEHVLARAWRRGLGRGRPAAPRRGESLPAAAARGQAGVREEDRAAILMGSFVETSRTQFIFVLCSSEFLLL